MTGPQEGVPGSGPAGGPRTAWAAWADGQRRAVAEAGRWREPRTFTVRAGSGTTGTVEGRPGEVVSFAANDYLGLATHPTVVAAAHAALDRWGTGSGASRLVTGSRPVHAALEEALAAWTPRSSTGVAWPGPP
jgi:7-keto-8-aminopelargonate synthetase-like enzyme